MKNTFNTILSILILVVLAAGVYFIVQTVRESAVAVTAPFQQVNQANEALQTQVSQLMNPTPTIIPDPVTYINEIRALARLETIQYSVEKVITAEVGQDTFSFFLGDKLLFVAHGVVIAGIDMEKLQPADMRLDDGVLYVHLPLAEMKVGLPFVHPHRTDEERKSDEQRCQRADCPPEICLSAKRDRIDQRPKTGCKNYKEDECPKRNNRARPI